MINDEYTTTLETQARDMGASSSKKINKERLTLRLPKIKEHKEKNIMQRIKS